MNGLVPMRRHTSLPLRSLEENLLGERRNKRREAGDCRLGTSTQIAWVLSPRPKTQCGSALSLNPTTVHMGPPRAAISPFPEADALTAGPPLAHALWGPTAAGSRCLTVQPLRAHSLPLHHGPQRPFRRTHSPAPRPRPRDPPLTCRPVRLRELRREPPVRLYAASLDARYSASCLEPNSSLAHWIS